MRVLTIRRAALLGLLVLAATAVACSSGESARQQRDAAQAALATREGGIKTAAPAASATTTAAAAPAAAPAGGASSTVAVTLKEWSVAASPAQGSAGRVEFNAKNEGAIPHEFVVLKTDTAQDKLAQKSGTVDQSKVQVVGRVDQFGTGETKKLTATMQPGNYVLICDVVGHYQLGMHTGFTVK